MYKISPEIHNELPGIFLFEKMLLFKILVIQHSKAAIRL